MKRTPLRRTRMKRKAPPPGFPDDVKAQVRHRSGNRCEFPGCIAAATHFHHRKLRRHGDHRPCNALHVCAKHHDHIHSNVARSLLLGWLVHSTLDPAEVPVKPGD